MVFSRASPVNVELCAAGTLLQSVRNDFKRKFDRVRLLIGKRLGQQLYFTDLIRGNTPIDPMLAFFRDVTVCEARIEQPRSGHIDRDLVRLSPSQDSYERSRRA